MEQKLRKCKICHKTFKQINSLNIYCSPKCAIEGTLNNIDKKVAKNKLNAAKELRKAKEAIKTRAEWVKEAQTAFNSYIRARDKYLPCISCQRFHTGQYHAGHYRTTSVAPELRFNENNVHKQCSACNNHKHGNITEYRINLVKRIGIELVEYLEGKHEPKKYTIDDLKKIKAFYKQKLKDIKP